MSSAATQVSTTFVLNCDRQSKELEMILLLIHACFVVEGDTGGPGSNPDGYQDALSKKQRRPQEDDRRRKEQGAGVS